MDADARNRAAEAGIRRRDALHDVIFGSAITLFSTAMTLCAVYIGSVPFAAAQGAGTGYAGHMLATDVGKYRQACAEYDLAVRQSESQASA